MIDSDNKSIKNNKESISKEYKTKDMIEGDKERKNDIIKEYIKNMNEEDFLYLSEHLKIRLDNEIFMSQELNDYINKHIDIICELHFKNFKKEKPHMKNVFIDLTLKLKYLRHLEYLKRKKKKDKENKNINKKDEQIKENMDEVRKNELYQSNIHNKDTIIKCTNNLKDKKDLSNKNILDHNKNILDDNKNIVELTLQDISSGYSETSCKSVNSLKFGNSSSSSSCDDNSSFLFSCSSDCDEDTSDEELLSSIHFDKREMSTLKSLEKAKNVYFAYINNKLKKYDILDNFNVNFLELVNHYLSDIKWNGNDLKKSNEYKDRIKEFLSNEENVKKIELNQSKLRSDILNSMFGFHIINETHPMKLPIKNMNNLSYQNGEVNNIYAYKSNTNKHRVYTKLGQLYESNDNIRNMNYYNNIENMNTKDNIDNINVLNEWGKFMDQNIINESTSPGMDKKKKKINTKRLYQNNEKNHDDNINMCGEHQNNVKHKKKKSTCKSKHIFKSNEVSIYFNDDIKKIEHVAKKELEEYIKEIYNKSKIHNKISSLKQYILMTHWKELTKHNNYMSLLCEEKKRNCKILANLCYNQMKSIDQKRKIILEKEERERMKLLKDNDMEAYMKLIRTAKNKRLQELLDVTDEFLNNMSKCVLYQKKESSEQNVHDIIDTKNDESGICNKSYNKKDKDNILESVNNSRIHLQEPNVYNNKKLNESIIYEHNEKNRNICNYKNARENYYNISHVIKEKVKQPSILIGGELMKYQLEGLEWLVSLYNNNLHGILADEMGLGKTIQTISLFAYLKEYKNNINVKNLIIVPLSTLPNWLSEFNRWCPSLKVITYRGNKLERKHIGKKLLEQSFDICITTFDLIIKQKSFLMKISWNYIVVDEGHRMKNNKSRFHIFLSEFKSKYRILLTGTPLQNNLSELWSLLNFLLPKIFSSCIDFENWFVKSLNNEKDIYENITEEEQLLIINRLHSVLLPFMLRRVKKDVLKSLPKKYEYNIHIELSLYQKILYKQIQNKGFKQVNHNGSITTKIFQNIVMQLRKIVNHPYLFLYDYNIDENIIKSSGKFEVLDRMLPKLLKFKHKVLIFSQMTKLMNILCDYLEFRGYKYHRLDGNIGLQQRKKIIDQFNNNMEYKKDATKQDNSEMSTGKNINMSSSKNMNMSGSKNMITPSSKNMITPSSNNMITPSSNNMITSSSQNVKMSNLKKEEINDFQIMDEKNLNGGNEDAMIFILSTRSGSLGLNLQTADTVIIFDSDFNPHQDIQAMCRCHRIGQKNVVKVFRFITLSGVEELVFKKAQHKLSINDKVIQAGLFNKIYNDEDRQNKLKDIIQRNQKNDMTMHPTNPLLLNYYMKRNEEELEYFLDFDKHYFGEQYFSLLNSLNIENVDSGQFTYMSEDEKEEKETYLSSIIKKEKKDEEAEEDEEDQKDMNKEKEKENEKKKKKDILNNKNNDDDEIKSGSNINEGAKGRILDEYYNDNTKYVNLSNDRLTFKRKHDNDDFQCDDEKINQNVECGVDNIMQNKNNKRLKMECQKDDKDNDINDNMNDNMNDSMNNLSVDDKKKKNISFSSENDNTKEYSDTHDPYINDKMEVKDEEDYYGFILKEENQNDIEKILIKSNKLINKDELPAYLFYDDRNDSPDKINLKRSRKVININLMEEEKLTEKQFLKLIDSSPSKLLSSVEKDLSTYKQDIMKSDNEHNNDITTIEEVKNKEEIKGENIERTRNTSPLNMKDLQISKNLTSENVHSTKKSTYNMRSSKRRSDTSSTYMETSIRKRNDKNISVCLKKGNVLTKEKKKNNSMDENIQECQMNDENKKKVKRRKSSQ
ncbi:DEAD/DEAH box helicase, putative [Plasmodium gaboni]|uniref:DEAD/DEAH box helicase, putative n=1 Tax=Plasmodium gaboni TaxID=647221 RepID=A0ABY1UGZ0_9APIC|nr:DEAD/DEAH box helicase, putative [Plasmodium gaboni]